MSVAIAMARVAHRHVLIHAEISMEMVRVRACALLRRQLNLVLAQLTRSRLVLGEVAPRAKSLAAPKAALYAAWEVMALRTFLRVSVLTSPRLFLTIARLALTSTNCLRFLLTLVIVVIKLLLLLASALRTAPTSATTNAAVLYPQQLVSAQLAQPTLM